MADDWMKWCRSNDSTIFQNNVSEVACWYVEEGGREVG